MILPLRKAHNPNDDKFIQNELARTFFRSGEKAPGKKEKQPRRGALPWIIASGTILLLCASFLFDNKLAIDVKVLKGTTLRGPGDNKVYLYKEGELNTYLLRDAEFSGGGDKYSRADKSMLAMINSRNPGWANFDMEFKEPVNMTAVDVVYEAKGQTGSESMVLALVDKERNAYRMQKDLSSRLGREWKEYNINLGPARDKIDLSRITRLQLEFGSLTAGNDPGATIFIREVRLVNRKKPGWL